MIATLYQLFELERLESGLVTILNSKNILTQGKFDNRTNETSRVELNMSFGGVEGRRYLKAGGFTFSPAQPHNVWRFGLKAKVFTERNEIDPTRNHLSRIGMVRCELNYFSLVGTFTSAVCPFHAITSIEESEAQIDTSDDEKNLWITELGFSGLAGIRDSAWPAS